MKFDYEKYVSRFDLHSPQGVRDLLQSALTDWRNDDITDEQFDDLVARSVTALTNGN